MFLTVCRTPSESIAPITGIIKHIFTVCSSTLLVINPLVIVVRFISQNVIKWWIQGKGGGAAKFSLISSFSQEIEKNIWVGTPFKG